MVDTINKTSKIVFFILLRPISLQFLLMAAIASVTNQKPLQIAPSPTKCPEKMRAGLAVQHRMNSTRV
jgi:hypothetical protein